MFSAPLRILFFYIDFPLSETLPIENVSLLSHWEHFVLPTEGASELFKDMQIISNHFSFPSFKTDFFLTYFYQPLDGVCTNLN